MPPQWGSSDANTDAVLWAPAQLKAAPNTANKDALYLNATADAWVTGANIGMYAVDENEINFANATFSSTGAAHTGWILRTEGSGGRAGRVQTEVLVAGGIVDDNDSDDTVYPE